MSEQQALALIAKAMSDTTPLTLEINIRGAWLLVSALQLTTRHPSIGAALKQQITDVALQFQDRIVDLHPEVYDLLQAGWNPLEDVPQQ